MSNGACKQSGGRSDQPSVPYFDRNGVRRRSCSAAYSRDAEPQYKRGYELLKIESRSMSERCTLHGKSLAAPEKEIEHGSPISIPGKSRLMKLASSAPRGVENAESQSDRRIMMAATKRSARAKEPRVPKTIDPRNPIRKSLAAYREFDAQLGKD